MVQANLNDLRFIGTESMDAVVSISSLEHNSLENLAAVVSELMRVLKPGGRLIATVGASRDVDSFHEPSSGWCFTDATLRSVFGLDSDCVSNFSEYDLLFDQLTENQELQHNLAAFYYRSGRNGMPWGRWDPQYQSVGVVKVKRGARTVPAEGSRIG